MRNTATIERMSAIYQALSPLMDERMCRQWGGRRVFVSDDRFSVFYQYTDSAWNGRRFDDYGSLSSEWGTLSPVCRLGQ